MGREEIEPVLSLIAPQGKTISEGPMKMGREEIELFLSLIETGSEKTHMPKETAWEP